MSWKSLSFSGLFNEANRLGDPAVKVLETSLTQALQGFEGATIIKALMFHGPVIIRLVAQLIALYELHRAGVPLFEGTVSRGVVQTQFDRRVEMLCRVAKESASG